MTYQERRKRDVVVDILFHTIFWAGLTLVVWWVVNPFSFFNGIFVSFLPPYAFFIWMPPIATVLHIRALWDAIFKDDFNWENRIFGPYV